MAVETGVVKPAADEGVVARAARVLRAVGDAPAGSSLGQIATRSGLARSTVQRLVAALAAERLVSTAGAGQITLGPELLRLGARVQADAPTRLRAEIRALSIELGETVDLSVVREDHVVFLDQAPGTQRLVAVSRVGAAFPLHCCASGKAFLAGLDDGAVEALLGRRYARLAPHTHTTLAGLLADLVAVRRTGIAIDDEEHTDGISAVGIGLHDGEGQWFGISVPMPTQRFDANRAKVVRRMQALRASWR